MVSLVAKFKKVGTLKVVKNFSELVFGNLVYQVFNLLSLIYIARRLKSEGFGEFSYLLVQGQLFATIASIGIKNILIRNIARDLNQSNTIFWAGIYLQGIGFIGSIILLGLYSWLVSPYDAFTFVILSINIMSLNFWDTSEAVYMAHQRMLYPGVLKSITLAIWVVFIFVISNKLFTYQTMFITYTIVLFINIVVAYFALKQAKLLDNKIVDFAATVKNIFGQALPYFILIVVNLPINFLANNFLKINSSNAELGYFNTSNRLTQPVKLITTLALSSFFPNVSVLWVNNAERFKDKIQQLMPLFINILLLICVFFSIFSKEIILIVFGKDYLPAIFIFKYQIWFVFLFTIQGLVGTLWMAADKQRILSICGIANAILCTPVLWFGSYYGAKGEALAYFLSYLIITPLLFFVFYRSLKLTFSVMIKPSIASLAVIAIGIFIPDNSLILRIGVCALIFFVILYFNNGSIKAFFKRENQ